MSAGLRQLRRIDLLRNAATALSELAWAAKEGRVPADELLARRLPELLRTEDGSRTALAAALKHLPLRQEERLLLTDFIDNFGAGGCSAEEERCRHTASRLREIAARDETESRRTARLCLSGGAAAGALLCILLW